MDCVNGFEMKHVILLVSFLIRSTKVVLPFPLIRNMADISTGAGATLWGPANEAHETTQLQTSHCCVYLIAIIYRFFIAARGW